MIPNFLSWRYQQCCEVKPSQVNNSTYGKKSCRSMSCKYTNIFANRNFVSRRHKLGLWAMRCMAFTSSCPLSNNQLPPYFQFLQSNIILFFTIYYSNSNFVIVFIQFFFRTLIQIIFIFYLIASYLTIMRPVFLELSLLQRSETLLNKSLKLDWGLVNGMGSPGVFPCNPYPNLSKPPPIWTGPGFDGLGYGFGENPRDNTAKEGRGGEHRYFATNT